MLERLLSDLQEAASLIRQEEDDSADEDDPLSPLEAIAADALGGREELRKIIAKS